MTKSKALMAALSVVAIAGMTACSKDKAAVVATPSVETPAAQEAGLTAEQIAQKRMDARMELTSNLQALVDARYSADRCDTKIVSDMIYKKEANTVRGKEVKTRTETARILSGETNFRGKQLAAQQLIAKSGNPACKVNALSEVAKKTIESNINTLVSDVMVSEKDYEKSIDQAGIIYSVIEPMQSKIKSELDALDAEGAAFAASAERSVMLRKQISAQVSLMETQMKEFATLVLNCESAGTCTSEVKKMAARSHVKVMRDMSDAQEYVNDFKVLPDDKNLTSKNSVLASKLSILKSDRITVDYWMAGLSGKDSPEARVNTFDIDKNTPQ